jgi:elongator complex protein 3
VNIVAVQTTLSKALAELARTIVQDPNLTKSQMETLKRGIAKRYGLKRFVRNSEIIEHVVESDLFNQVDKEYLIEFLKVRRVRTLSGIAVVAVMTKPSPCPGKCIYCPEVDGAPKAYTGREPAAMRGAQNDFHPERQVCTRLSQLKSIGHQLDKIHLVVMGGTFLATSKSYQEYFIQGCLDGITQIPSASLEEAQKFAETSGQRNVGITIETRPDYCTPPYVNRILELGGTFVEIGVQTLSQTVMDRVNRHQTLKDVEAAIRSARDGGLKVAVHMMPNLFHTPEEDIIMFDQLYTDPRFIPDAVKIYPTLVLEDTKLYELWQTQEYRPYDADQVVDVIAQVKAITPPFVRIQRVQRDIPAYLILDGVNQGNLRELAQVKLKQINQRCSCIRCREVGHQTNLGHLDWIGKDKSYHIHEYPASEGIEHFITYETTDQETLFGFLRLREPSSSAFRPEIRSTPTTLIRELHVYGRLVGLGKLPREMTDWQHRGIGKKLISMAEEISIERGYEKILVTSGLGVRDYYRKLGFQNDGVYMSKMLK